MFLACAPTAVAGQGMPFHMPSALTMSFEERGVRAYTALQSRGDVTSAVLPVVVLPFAPHERLTTAIELPLIYRRMADPGGAARVAYSASGLGDVVVSAKFAFLVRNRFAGTTRVAAIVAAGLPTGSTGATMNGGLPAPRPLQLGTGAASGSLTVVATLVRNRWGFGASIGHTRRAADAGFRFGDETRYNLAVSLRIPEDVATIRTRTLQLYLEWNGSLIRRSTSGGVPLADSGGHLTYMSPGIQWVLLPRFLIEGSLQIPVLQNHNGVQPDYGVRPALGARFLFF